GEGAAFAAPVARKIFARYFQVSDIRAPYGCDTAKTTPDRCAAQKVWDGAKVVYNDPVDGEGPSDYHDPEFPN
ncbi:MAG: hypothetical protein KGJ86_17795, partial [Chloroflexota bacterium]|nr:hypothetical protein [Chloroflexota bacterium]